MTIKNRKTMVDNRRTFVYNEWKVANRKGYDRE